MSPVESISVATGIAAGRWWWKVNFY